MSKMKSIKTFFYVSVFFMLLMSLSFLIMTIATEKSLEGEQWWYILSGSLFWFPLIIGYVFFFMTDRMRKKETANNVRGWNIKGWGIFKLASNIMAIIFEIVLSISLIVFIVLVVGKSEKYIYYNILLSIITFSLHMHALYNGENYKYIKKTEMELKKGGC